jgi:hypothetical protein
MPHGMMECWNTGYAVGVVEKSLAAICGREKDFEMTGV